MKLLVAQLNPIVGDIKGNKAKILNAVALAKTQKVDLVLFSELAICGYPPEDFLTLPGFIEACFRALEDIIAASSRISLVVGIPRRRFEKGEKNLSNSAAVISNGQLLGFQDKALLPTYDVFDERRYFEPASEIRLWPLAGKQVAITICEDIWQHSERLLYTRYLRDPVKELAAFSPDIVLNLSASPYSYMKQGNRQAICCRAAKTLGCPLILCNQVGGNDSLIFDGQSLLIDSKGNCIAKAKSFEEDHWLLDLDHLPPQSMQEEDALENMFHALVMGVRDYFNKMGFKRACLGLSGGIDSALVACIGAQALGAENVLAVAMPSRFSSAESLKDASQLVQNLKIPYKEISIEPPFQSYLDLLTPYFESKPQDVTEENLQARVRGMILMALSNKLGYVILSTGNKSELAVGYSTLYGDMCGGLAVIGDVLKTDVYRLAYWLNQRSPLIPESTLVKAPSAELRMGQKDSDSLPDYAVVDAVVQAYIEEDRDPDEIARTCKIPLSIVQELVVKIHRSEYKRRQGPLALRVTEKAFSVGRRFPIVQKWV